MESSIGGHEDKLLRDFIAAAVDEVKYAESTGPSTALPPAWMDVIEGVSSGTTIGPYQITERLGSGGMGLVFKGFDSTLRRDVAVKFLSPRLAVSAVARLRFTREARAAAAINHPNVVTIHGIGEHEGLPYLVMEYVAGITLAERLKREGMLELKSILRIGIQMTRGLSAAHSQGLIHRDIKPANVLLEGGIDRAKISDFGLACITTEPWRLTASGVLLGTPAYMSPEQACGGGLDHRSDLFSLGSVLYELCTGEPPFSGPSIKFVLTQVREGEPRPVRDLNPDIPPALENHIRRLMAKNAAERFPSANELLRSLVRDLAEIQGANSDQPVDDSLDDLFDLEVIQAGGGRGKFEIVDNEDELDLSPTAGDSTPVSRLATSRSTLWPRVLKILALVAVVLTAVAVPFWLPWLERNLGADRAIVLLLAFAGLAVLTWMISQLLAGAYGLSTVPATSRTVGRLRNWLMAGVLGLVSFTAYREWSAYAEATRALRAVDVLRSKFANGYTRREIEALIGRVSDGPALLTLAATRRAAYRWKGVFNTHTLYADYAPRRKTGVKRNAEENPGEEVLVWIASILE